VRDACGGGPGGRHGSLPCRTHTHLSCLTLRQWITIGVDIHSFLHSGAKEAGKTACCVQLLVWRQQLWSDMAYFDTIVVAAAAAGGGSATWSLLHSLPCRLCSSNGQPFPPAKPRLEPKLVHTTYPRPLPQANGQRQRQQKQQQQWLLLQSALWGAGANVG
jgi:hypothetical protein